MKRILRRMTAFAVLLILLLLCGCDGQQTPVETTQEPAGDRVINVNAVGDIYLTDEMLSDAIKPDGTYDFMSQFSDVYACLSKADLTIGNFEGNFSGEPYGPATGSYPNELAAALNDAGFDLLQTANSYSVYNGLAGLQRTKMVIENNGMQTMGTYSSQHDRQDNQVACLELDGIRVAVIAMTKGLGGMSLPADDRYCVDLLYSDYDSDYEQIDEAGILSVIQAAEALNPDIIIACLHCGIGPSKASTRSRHPSAILSTRSTSPPKSECPGVSIILIFVPFQFIETFFERIVIPRSRSRSLLSNTCPLRS